MLSKVDEIVFFAVMKSNGESCASLGNCVDSFSFPLGIWSVKPGRRVVFSRESVALGRKGSQSITES